MDAFTACGIIEGFAGPENPTEQDQLEAWAFLIKTGQCWSLQGSYGRGANALIEGGYISKEGEILV